MTSREEGVSVNCEFTLICESESDEDAVEDGSEDEVSESDEGAVDMESESEVGVGMSDEEVEEEIAEAEVMVDDEEMVELLSTDDAAEEEGDEAEEEGVPAPAGGNLSSAPLLVSRSWKKEKTHSSPVNAK